MNVARFNFSHGTHEYHQETLDNFKIAMQNTQILCALMLDTKGPEIRTGFLKDGKPIQLTEGQEITVSTDTRCRDRILFHLHLHSFFFNLKEGNCIESIFYFGTNNDQQTLLLYFHLLDSERLIAHNIST